MLRQPGIGANYSFFKKAIRLSIMFSLHAWLGIFSLCWLNSTNAQIIRDESLGNEASQVTPNVNIKGLAADRIDGGATRGINLFHSFQEFNIRDSQRVYFSNPAGIENILTRVTGGKVSNILGTLGVDGSANLFLINPSGIVFGENARLDVGGSFLASTADAVKFGEDEFFSASSPDIPSDLLRVKPSALFFNQLQAGRIENRSISPTPGNLLEDTLLGLRVSDDRSLLMIGGEIAIDGGGLHAPGGRVELAGIAASGTIGLNIDGNNLNLTVPENIARADISLSNEAFVNSSGSGGGAITVWGKNVRLSDGSQIAATTLDATDGRGLTVNASESVQLIGTTANKLLSSGLFTQTAGIGDAGDITITTKRLLLEDGARILVGTFDEGNAGNLTVNASESVEMIGGTGFTPFGVSFSSRMGSDTGNWFGSRLRLIRSVIQSPATGKGDDVTIQTRQMRLLDGAQIGASTRGDGEGGDLRVNASQSVQLIGVDPFDGTPSGLFSQTQGKGNAGNISINTGSLSIINSQSGSFSSGKGNAGDLIVNASELVEIKGKVVSGNIESPALLAAQVETRGEGKGGDLNIETKRLSVSNGGKVQVATFGKGNAGNLIIRASEVEVFDTPVENLFATGINAGVEIDPDQTVIPPEGDGGVLRIETERLSVRNGAEISVSTAGKGNAGELQINASESVEVVGTSPQGNFKSRITAAVTPDGIGTGGSLKIETGKMIVRDGAEVTVSSLGTGVAGELLEVKADSIIIDNQAAIAAITREGNGGNINLNLQELLLLRNGSEISTSAGNDQFGGDGGNISINSPFVVAVPQEDSNITANAFNGSGGKVDITTKGIFGIQSQPKLTDFSDITASSTLGIDGEVSVDNPDVNPSKGLEELPADVVNAAGLINQNLCTAARVGSEFVITGRGGLPTSPHNIGDANSTWEDWSIAPEREISKPSSVRRNSQSEEKSEQPTPIVEAQGWVVDSNGDVIFTAFSAKVNKNGTWLHPLDCQRLREAS